MTATCGPEAPQGLLKLLTRLLTAGAAGEFPAAVISIYRGPGAGLGFVLRNAAFLVAFFDVLGLALLLVGILRFISLRYGRR